MTTTTRPVIAEFGATIVEAEAISDTLGLSPCEALEAYFPAIVGDEDTMAALAAMLDPVVGTVGPLVESGIVTPEDAEMFLHNVFHLLQVAAALGHALGVAEAIGVQVEEVPDDLSGIAWGDLPDALGDA